MICSPELGPIFWGQVKESPLGEATLRVATPLSDSHIHGRSAKKIVLRPEIDNGEKYEKKAETDNVDTGELGDTKDKKRIEQPHAHGQIGNHEAELPQLEQAVRADVKQDR